MALISVKMTGEDSTFFNPDKNIVEQNRSSTIRHDPDNITILNAKTVSILLGAMQMTHRDKLYLLQKNLAHRAHNSDSEGLLVTIIIKDRLLCELEKISGGELDLAVVTQRKYDTHILD